MTNFLDTILPTQGVYCAVGIKNKIVSTTFHSTTADVDAASTATDAAAADAYFAMASFKDNSSRKSDNALYLRSFFLDLDCGTGKPYADQPAAATALKAFLQTTQLPDPYVVNSGGGLHVYWPLTEDVEVDVWVQHARALKALCKKHQLHADPAVTSDASRILRVPDTTNTGLKNGKAVRGQTKVRGISEGDRFSVDDIDAILTAEGFGKEFVKPAPTSSSLALAGHRPTNVNSSPSSLSKALTQNSVTMFKKILLKTRDGAGCAQLQNYIENAEEDGMEPVWRGLLSWAKVCDDGEKAVVWLSDLHPYDHERMHRKLAEIKGPYSCAAMDDAQPGICRGCPHWGKITNPLIWGREMAVVTEAMTVEVEAPADEEEDTIDVMLPEPPRGYAYGKRGGVFAEKVDEDAEGKKVTRQILLCAQTIYPIDILNNNGNHEVHFGVIRDKHVREVLLQEGGDVVSNTPQEFATIIREEHAKWRQVVKTAAIAPE